MCSVSGRWRTVTCLDERGGAAPLWRCSRPYGGAVSNDVGELEQQWQINGSSGMVLAEPEGVPHVVSADSANGILPIPPTWEPCLINETVVDITCFNDSLPRTFSVDLDSCPENFSLSDSHPSRSLVVNWRDTGCPTLLDPSGTCCRSGVLDAAFRCCPTGVLNTVGVCCQEGQQLTPCGDCAILDPNIPVMVDFFGTCCSQLDAQQVCCTSGDVDSCGICGGRNNCTFVAALSCTLTGDLPTDTWSLAAVAQILVTTALAPVTRHLLQFEERPLVDPIVLQYAHLVSASEAGILSVGEVAAAAAVDDMLKPFLTVFSVDAFTGFSDELYVAILTAWMRSNSSIWVSPGVELVPSDVQMRILPRHSG